MMLYICSLCVLGSHAAVSSSILGYHSSTHRDTATHSSTSRGRDKVEGIKCSASDAQDKRRDEQEEEEEDEQRDEDRQVMQRTIQGGRLDKVI